MVIVCQGPVVDCRDEGRRFSQHNNLNRTDKNKTYSSEVFPLQKG